MTAVIDNDTLQGFPQMGSDLGNFMANLAPGLGKFMLITAIFLGIIGIFGGIAFFIGSIIKKVKTK